MRIAFLATIVLTIALACPAAVAQDKKIPGTPLTPAEEKAKLKILKNAEFDKQKAILFSEETGYEEKLSALKTIAAFETEKAVELLCTLYESPIAEERADEEKALIVELLGRIKSPASQDILLKASKYPGKGEDIRLASVEAIYNTLGKDALPYLRQLSEDSAEKVKHAALTKLLELRDLSAARKVFGMLAGDDKLVALKMIKEAHLTEAAEEVARIAKETDIEKGPNEKILKLKALETALDLGQKESIPVAIEIVEVIKREHAEVLEVFYPLSMLRYYCGEDFGFDRKKWQEWWDSGGKDIPLLSKYTDTSTLKDIAETLVEHIKKNKSDLLENYDTIYLEDSPLANVLSDKNDTIRVYKSSDISLISKEYLHLFLLAANDRRATVSIITSRRSKSDFYELAKSDGKWKIKKINGMPVKAP